MKTKTFISAIIISLVWAGCTVPKNLPEPQVVDSYQYGCLINVKTISHKIILGELLAVDSVGLLILPVDTTLKEATYIKKDIVRDYTVYYAKPKNYNWTIPTFGVATASHGLFAFFTLPVNLLTTSLISSNAIRTYTYNRKNLSFDQLRMFSRYPQGLQPDFKIVSYR